MHVHVLTYSPTHLLTYSLRLTPTHLPHSLTHSYTHSLSHSLPQMNRQCQNAMPLKETLLKGDRIDEDDYDELVEKYGVEVLSDITILPFVHSMPGQALRKHAAFDQLLIQELTDGFERFKVRADGGDLDAQRVIHLLEAAAPEWTEVNLQDVSEEIRLKTLHDLEAPADHPCFRPVGDPLRADRYGFCPRIHPSVPLLSWTLNVSDLQTARAEDSPSTALDDFFDMSSSGGDDADEDAGSDLGDWDDDQDADAGDDGHGVGVQTRARATAATTPIRTVFGPK